MDEVYIKQKIALNLKTLKECHGFTLDKFAECCGIPVKTFSNYFYGVSMMSLDTVIKICNVLECSVSTLLNELITFENELPIIQHIIDCYNAIPTPFRELAIDLISSYVKTDTFGVLSDAKCGAKLRHIREDIRHDAREIAIACGIEEVTLNGYETGQAFPSIPIFINLCRELSITPEYLLCNHLTVTNFDKRFYALTPRKLSALSETTDKILNIFREYIIV